MTISIHALREEGDRFGLCAALPVHISIHALREEGDKFLHGKILFFAEFLSTPSARRATVVEAANAAHIAISIHALREEGDLTCWSCAQTSSISIHALREEGDSKNRDKISIFKQIIQHSARI